MLNYERMGLVVGLILFGLALFLVVELPTRAFSFAILGSPFTIRLSKVWFMAILLAGLAYTGTNYVLQVHPTMREPFIPSILPTMWVLLAVFLLPLAPHWLYWLGGLALTGISLFLLLAAEHYAIDPASNLYRPCRWILSIVAYLTALIFFLLIYRSKTRSLFSATTIFIAGSLLALDILDSAGRDLPHSGLYSSIVGLVLGEATWALNYCNLNETAGGVLLFLLFYLFTGLSKQRLQGRLNRRILLEFALVGLLVAGLLFRYGIWR